MIQFTITDQNDKKLRVTAPHSWTELNVKQLLDIENEDLQRNGLTRLFSIICGLDFASLTNSTDREIMGRIDEVCAFVKVPPVWESITCPTHIEIGFKAYKINKNIGKLMHGQIELIMEMGKDDINLLEMMPKIVAIIMQPSIDEGAYDGQRVEEIEQVILKSPALQVYGMSAFFFEKLQNILSTGMENSKKYLKLRMRKPSYYSDWLKVTDLADMQQ